MLKKCKWCGNQFHTNNKTKYCSKYCKEKGYQKKQKEARKRYNQKHKTTKITIRKCRWCQQPFISTHNKRYCCNQHKTYSLLERNLTAVRKYQKKYGRNIKDKYYAYLGTGNLREHMHADANVEYQLIHAELRRLKIEKKMGNL